MRRLVALAVVIASLALIVLWLGIRGSDGEAANDFAQRTDAPQAAPATIQLDGTTVETASVARVPARVANVRLADDAGRASNGAPLAGDVRVRFVDAGARPLTGLTGTVELRNGAASRSLGAHGEPHGYDELPSDELARALSVAKPGVSGREEFEPRVVTIPYEGDVVFDALPFGTYEVSARIDGFRAAIAGVNVRNSRPHGEVTLKLTAYRVFDIALRTYDGEPLIAALRELGPRCEAALWPRFDIDDPRAADSGFVSFKTSRVPSNDDAYWCTASAETHALVTMSLYVGDVVVARSNVSAGVRSTSVLVSPQSVIDALATIAK
jgi:hypothetical protein